MRPIAPIPEHVPPELRPLLKDYVASVTRLYGDTLQSVVLYGSAARGEFLTGRSNVNLLLVVTNHDVETLRQYAKSHRRWAKESVVAPLILSADEIAATQSQFPLEYLEIQEAHVILAGVDPLVQLQVDDAALASACLRELHTHVIRLRQRVIESAGKTEGELMLLPLSLSALLPVIRGLLRVRGHMVPLRTEPLLAELEKQFGVAADALRDAWRIKRGEITPGPLEVPRLLQRYLDAVNALIAAVRRA